MVKPAITKLQSSNAATNRNWDVLVSKIMPMQMKTAMTMTAAATIRKAPFLRPSRSNTRDAIGSAIAEALTVEVK